MNEKSYYTLLSCFKKSKLVVLDFSAIINSDQVIFDELMNIVVEQNVKTVVTAEFYENYKVVSNSMNDEQKRIIKKAYNYLDMLERKGLLLNLPNVYDNRELVNKMNSVSNVCYILYKVSELAEALEVFGEHYLSVVFYDEKEPKICGNATKSLEAFKNDIDKDVLKNGYFSVESLPEEGSTAYLSDKYKFKIGKYIAGGGEGEVYECNYKPYYVTKVYHDGQLNVLRVKKMLHMEEKQIMYDGLCWPERVVYTENNEPIGFVMKRLNGKSMSAVFDSYESVNDYFPKWKRRDLIQLCIKVLSRIQYLHMFGILIGDVRLNNIMVDKTGEPWLVDLDSCQVDNLPCPGGFGEFTPFELQDKKFNQTLRSYYNESFSCSVIVFKILFCGLHPYDQIDGSDSIEEDIAKKAFPFSLNVNDDFSKIVFNDYYSKVWKNTPYQFQKFFVDIFKYGERPNIQTMLMMLRTYDDFIRINENKFQNINQIVFNS